MLPEEVKTFNYDTNKRVSQKVKRLESISKLTGNLKLFDS